jgi:hypothetical protein
MPPAFGDARGSGLQLLLQAFRAVEFCEVSIEGCNRKGCETRCALSAKAVTWCYSAWRKADIQP